MEMPSWILPQPPFVRTAETLAAFDALYATTPPGQEVAYNLAYPKWQYLIHLGETKNVVLHGSARLDLEQVKPQQANDVRDFSNQNGIYATTDGIWAMFFAILDRQTYPMGLVNSCASLQIGPDVWSDPVYFFSITQSALERQPWIQGMIYILPKTRFKQDPLQDFNGMTIQVPHWVGLQPETPIARLRVGPEDFPFLAQIRGHDDERVFRLAKEKPEEFPWLEE